MQLFPNLREQFWYDLKTVFSRVNWDIIIVGGGITGAGILLESARLGLKALLVEKQDFASGSSSRTSKLVHGGLRYLKEGHLFLTRHSVVEREHLLKEAENLVSPLEFLLTLYQKGNPSRLVFEIGLALYDLVATHWDHRHINKQEVLTLFPSLNGEQLKGGFLYKDAQVDDARLVFRVIQEAMNEGGLAINYVSAQKAIRKNGQVIGLSVRNEINQETLDLSTKLVVNATGVWVNSLCETKSVQIRPLRGSHLVFSKNRFSVPCAMTLFHPRDQRTVFVIPWEGVTLVGTTDLDHKSSLDSVSISNLELEYLFELLHNKFPQLNLCENDILSSFSGIRPVISTGKADPSKESRDFKIWDESGLVSITGGKLTTFRKMALDLLSRVKHYLPEENRKLNRGFIFNKIDIDLSEFNLEPVQKARILSRFGKKTEQLFKHSSKEDLETIPSTNYLWAELKWSAQAELVVKLEDLLLRRSRLGLLLPQGGKDYLKKIRQICQPALGWSDNKWDQEEKEYLLLWQSHYFLAKQNE